jgi:N-acetyl-anhydromuramyl-L-alanine amidase AmpD
MSYVINKNYPCNSSNYGGVRSKSSIKYIVVHYTAGTSENGTAALSNAKYFMTGGRNASAHFFVDSGNVVYQSVNPLRVAWSVGANKYYSAARNSNTLNVEICSYKKNGTYYFNEKAVRNAQLLIYDLMQEYGISIDNVIRHYDVTRKICPAPLIAQTDWQNFKNGIGSKYIFVDVEINGKTVRLTGYFENGENWIKTTSALEAIGYSAKWDSNKKRVVAVKDGKEILLDIRTCISEDNRAFSPLREIFESLGYTVEWVAETKKIVIKSE